MNLFILKVLSNIALAVASMAIGSAVTAVVIGMRRRRMPEQSTASITEDAARTQINIEQIRQLALDVANDVGDHGLVMAGWSEQLDATQKSGDGSAAEIQSLVEGMISANHKLHSRLKEAEQKIATQAEEIKTQESNAKTDALTGLANRRAFDLELVQAMPGSGDESEPCSLLVFDIDHFKSFNDAHGHLAGDEVLRTVGRTFAQVVRKPFLAARYGGEEFAAILPRTTSRQAKELADRLRISIEGTAIMFEGKSLSVTASIGVSQAVPGEQARELVRRADEGVYAAKAAGRNRCFWHDGVQVLPTTQASSKRTSSGLVVSNGCTKTAIEDFIKLPCSSLPGPKASLESLVSEGVLDADRCSDYALICVCLTSLPALRGHDEQGSVALLNDLAATTIKQSCREIDRLSYAGEGEFIVALPGLSESAARIVSQRIRTAIESHPVPTEGGVARIEVAIGVMATDLTFNIQQSIELARQLALPVKLSDATEQSKILSLAK